MTQFTFEQIQWTVVEGFHRRAKAILLLYNIVYMYEYTRRGRYYTENVRVIHRLYIIIYIYIFYCRSVGFRLIVLHKEYTR